MESNRVGGKMDREFLIRHQVVHVYARNYSLSKPAHLVISTYHIRNEPEKLNEPIRLSQNVFKRWLLHIC